MSLWFLCVRVRSKYVREHRPRKPAPHPPLLLHTKLSLDTPLPRIFFSRSAHERILWKLTTALKSKEFTCYPKPWSKRRQNFHLCKSRSYYSLDVCTNCIYSHCFNLVLNILDWLTWFFFLIRCFLRMINEWDTCRDHAILIFHCRALRTIIFLIQVRENLNISLRQTKSSVIQFWTPWFHFCRKNWILSLFEKIKINK